FFIILSLLVLVHELGHFGVAKYFGIRVDEFGLGFPPKVKKLFEWKGTTFTLNALPFGGFVKIYGESPDDSDLKNSSDIPSGHGQSFINQNRLVQAAVLVAGVVGNFLFAWLLFSIGFMSGIAAPAGLDLPLTNPETVITSVLTESPAEKAGLKTGDSVVKVERGEASLFQPLTPETVSEFITNSFGPVNVTVERGDETLIKTITPLSGVWTETPAIGVAMEVVGTVKLPFLQSITQGFVTTKDLTVATAKGLVLFLSQAVTGRADFSTVAGPIGLVGMVGEANDLGFGYLLTFTALISINLAVLNLLPIPALDGGRLLFVGVEAISRRRIPSKFFNLVNTAGFFALVLLMIVISVNDVQNIVQKIF
ncbi:MAG: RIP metalloprotease RseP, partial [Patescibacteria group bacterium]